MPWRREAALGVITDMNGPNKRNTRIIDEGACFNLLVVKVISNRTKIQILSAGGPELFLSGAKGAASWPILTLLSIKKKAQAFDTSRQGRAMNKKKQKFGSDEQSLENLGRCEPLWSAVRSRLRVFLVETPRTQTGYKEATNIESLSEIKR